MLTLDATATARSQAGVAGLQILAEMQFASGTQYVTTWSRPIAHGGNTYTGLGDLVSVSNLSQSEDQGADKVVLGASIVNTAMLGLLIGPASEYRDKRVRLYGQFIDDTFQPAGAAVEFWGGYMDRVTVERKPAKPQGGGATGRANLECIRAGQARMRNASGLRRTHAQQLQRTGGNDTAFRYTQQLAEQPASWASVAFQRIP